jgi:hypothetical protein
VLALDDSVDVANIPKTSPEVDTARYDPLLTRLLQGILMLGVLHLDRDDSHLSIIFVDTQKGACELNGQLPLPSYAWSSSPVEDDLFFQPPFCRTALRCPIVGTETSA